MKWVISGFAGLHAVALFLLAIGTFGQERDPLSGILPVPLGLPWNLILDRLGTGGAAIAIAAPAVNATILYRLWKR